MRRVAREIVFKLIFEYTFNNDANEATLNSLLAGDYVDDKKRRDNSAPAEAEGKKTAAIELADDKDELYLTDDDKEYIRSTYYGVIREYDSLKSRIASEVDPTKAFTIDRIFRPELCALYLALYELEHHVAPMPVIINEAVDLAKKYGTDGKVSYELEHNVAPAPAKKPVAQEAKRNVEPAKKPATDSKVGNEFDGFKLMPVADAQKPRKRKSAEDQDKIPSSGKFVNGVLKRICQNMEQVQQND